MSQDAAVEQEQIQKRTFTNWVNAQLAKRRPPCRIVDLFEDFRDGSRLLDLLEVISGQRISRDRGRGMFQHRSNIEKCLGFLKKKSIKLVNINIPDIIDGKPSIILGLVWTIILQYHIEELASSLSFSSRQSSMESLASLDSSLSSRSASASPVPPGLTPLSPHGTSHPPLHSTFRVSAKKALLLWVREQCHKAGCTINVKDFRASWRSGVVFLAILSALRPGLVDLNRAQERSNRQNLEEAFRLAERELRIPRLLEPDDIDVREPDEKSIMTYVSQFLQYSRDLPTTEDDSQMVAPAKSPSPVNLPAHYTPAVSASPLKQATPDRKAQEVTLWLNQAYDELLEGWDSTEGESYSERYHVIQTFLVSFNEQRRPIMPLLTAMRRTPKLSDEQRALRQAWDAVTEKLREFRLELDVSLPPPLTSVAQWLLRAEGALSEDERDPEDHERAAEEARHKQEVLRSCLEEMPTQVKTFQNFHNLDEYGNMLVPTDKMDELKRRFTSVRVTAKYHGMKLEYKEHRHSVLDVLTQIRTKLRLWRRPYVSSEGVRVLLQEWHELVDRQDLPTLLEAALYKLKQVSEKYSSKSALASDYNQVVQQVKRLEEDSAHALEELKAVKSVMGRVSSAWDSYSDCLSSLQAWLQQGTRAHSHEPRAQVPSEVMAEWGSRQARLNEAGTFLIESTDPQTSRAMTEELRKVNLQWAEFVKRNTFDGGAEPGPVMESRPQDLQALIREATLVLKEPLETLAGPLRTYRKRLQFIMRRIKEMDVQSLGAAPEFSAEQLQKLRQAMPEVMQTLCEAEQVCAELQHSVSGLDTRLAEVLHWETEARDLYKLLKNQKGPQRGQDPRARVLISRGLQLEGQVVTEEQDLQLMVMNNQKNSPLQFLHASALQDRVRAVVQISQEAVGMLSSLGSRREKSPGFGPPPPKVFIQSKIGEDTTDQETVTTSETMQAQSTFTPAIVMQPPSPTEPYNFAEAVTRTSPIDVKIQIDLQSIIHQEQRVSSEPILEEMDLQEQGIVTGQFQDVKQAGKKQEDVMESPRVQDITQIKAEVHEKTLVENIAVKKTMTTQELKARKAQAMRNRPWLQKALKDGQKTEDLPKVQAEVATDAGKVVQPLEEANREKAQSKEHQKPPHPVRPMQPEPQLQEPVQSQNIQAKPDSVYPQGQEMQSKVSQVGNIETQVPPLVHSPVKQQQIATQAGELQAPMWGQGSPSSPVRSPSPQHFQIRSHPQSWAPVRPPSPKVPTQNQPLMQATSPERGVQIQPAQQLMPSIPQGLPQQDLYKTRSPERGMMQAAQLQVPPQTMPQSQMQSIGQQPQNRGTSPGRGPTQPMPVQIPKALQGSRQQVPFTDRSPERGAMQDRRVPDSQGSQGGPPMQQQIPNQTQQIPPMLGRQPQMFASSPERGMGQVRGVQDAPIRSPIPQVRPGMPGPMPSQPQAMQQNLLPTMAQQPQVYPRSPDRGGVQGRLGPDTQIPSQVSQMGPTPQHFPQQPPPQQMPQPMVQTQQAQPWMQYRGQSPAPMSPPLAPQPNQAYPQNFPQQWPQEQPSVPPQRQPMPQQYPPQAPPMQSYQQWGGQQGFVGYNQPWGQEQVRPASPMQYGPYNVQPQQVWGQQPSPPPPYSQYQQYQPYKEPLPGPLYPQQQNVQQSQEAPQDITQAEPKVKQPGQRVAAKPSVQTVTQPKVKPDLARQVSPQKPAKVELQKEVPQVVEAFSKPEVLSKVETQKPLKEDISAQAKPMPEMSLLETDKDKTPSLVAQTNEDVQPKALHQVKPHTITLTPTTPESSAQPTSPQATSKVPPFPGSSVQAKPQPVQSLVNIITQHDVDSPESVELAPVLAQAPPQAYTEAYLKAQALARNGFEEAKHCLQEHIMEAINVFEDKCVSAEQLTAKEETLRTLEPELLDEFLRAAKGMEAFCTPAQLRDMELFTQSVRNQWESCFSAKGSFSEAGSHLSALKSLCETLSPEDAHRLAQTQVRECETRLAAIQRQYSGETDAALPETRIPVGFSDELISTRDKPGDKAQASPEVSLKAAPVEKKEMEKQTSVEEELTKKEALEKYENSKKLLQAKLCKNEQSIQDVPSDSVSLKGLHTRLQEIQFLRQETEALWSDFVSQSAALPSSATGVEQERAELQEQWRQQQQSLQSRGSSLGAALRQIDSTENHMVDFSDRLGRFLRQPKDISGFTPANTNFLKDIKELDDNIQSELDQLSRLDPDSSGLDPRDCFPLSREVETHRSSLDQLRQQVRKSEAAARALDRFLMSLRTVDEDISGVQSAPCTDATEGRSKLPLIRQSIDSLKDKAPQLDLLLQGARLTVTQDGEPASCLDMVSALLRKLEEVDQQQQPQPQQQPPQAQPEQQPQPELDQQEPVVSKEAQGRSAGLRKRALLSELRKLQDAVEAQTLKEPTLPAVQQRLRSLSELDSQLQSLHAELQTLVELQDSQDSQDALGEALLDEVQRQWDDTRRALGGRKQQSSVLLELLKRFQSIRSQLSSSLQRAEQTISEQASYLGKDNLQKTIAKVSEMKVELGGLGAPLEELRGVCRQIQSSLRKIPDCNQTSFETEAESLMDNWLDVTEKTDAYMDNLQVALELWDKQLMLGTEVDAWAAAKLALFAASHPFHNEEQVLAMRDDINKNEENIDHFHRKSTEIQEMLQSQEAPLELQVIETQLRNRMEQVKELFTDCTDVFEELMAVKKHLTEKIEECQAAVENLQSCLSKCDASKPHAENQIQDFSEELDAQELQAESVLKEVSLVSSVASPQALESLSVDCARLREAISRTREMIHLKNEEKDKGLLTVLQDERQSFGEWFQDQQLSVNECFENPESRADVETAIQRLTGFLKSTDPERRLDQLRGQLQRGLQQVPEQSLREVSEFIREQQEEVDTFRTHCENRLTQMEELLGLLHSLQKQHDSFSDWLMLKEKQSQDPEKIKNLLKELLDSSAVASSLVDLLSSVRRQGVRGDLLLKDCDLLLQRLKDLESRVRDRDQTLRSLDQFRSRSKETGAWIRDLLQPLSSTPTQSEPEELKRTAQSILESKPEGDSRLSGLRAESQTLLDQDLDQDQRQEVQQRVLDLEESWRSGLDRSEEALRAAQFQVQARAQARAQLDRDLGQFRDQTDSVQAWISEQEDQVQSLRLLPVEEKLQVAESCLRSKPQGDSLLQDLKRFCQTLSQSEALDESRRRSVEEALRETEQQWSGVSRAADEALKAARSEAALHRDYEAFRDVWDKLSVWIKEQRQKVLNVQGLEASEERLQLAQAVLSSRPEGESRLRSLQRQAQSLVPVLDQTRGAEVQRMVSEAEQQWRSTLQTATQAELRGLSDDFQNQSQSAQTWIRDRVQQLQGVSVQSPPHDRIQAAQSVLNLKPDGDCRVNNLRRRGQSLSDHHSELSDERRAQIQQTVKDTETQWRNLLQNAQKMKSTAEEQIREEQHSQLQQLRELDCQREEVSAWLTDVQQRLDSLQERPTAEDRRHAAQVILSYKSEGDSRLQDLRRKSQSPDLGEQTKSSVWRSVEDLERLWAELMQRARLVLDQSERQCLLESLTQDYERLRQETTAWIQDREQTLKELEQNTEPEEAICSAQMILSLKPEGDCRLSELRRQTQTLLDRDEVDQAERVQAERVLTESEYQWREVLRRAEELLTTARLQYQLHRELDAFRAQATSTEAWLTDLQRQLQERGLGATGTQSQLQERLDTAQMVLNSWLNADAQLKELKRRGQSLSQNPDLDQDQRQELERRVRDTEEQWREALKTAEDQQRELQGVLERLVSVQVQRSQLESRLEELKTQTSDLSRVFPWPGLGERRQAVDQTRTMIDQTSALFPLLNDTRRQASELAEITQDQSLTSTNWNEMEENIPALLQQLTESLSSLEAGVLAERRVTQLMEQHEAAQDWLRDQVKTLGPTPSDKQELHNAVNTLKALLQTVQREQREMQDLDEARDALLDLCTPGGRDALLLDVGHLHDLCATSEQEVRRHLASCEAGAGALEERAARRSAGLRDRTSALQWELRSLDQALSYSQPQNNILQLQQHWTSLKNCEKSLEELRLKLDDLNQETSSAAANEELPSEISTIVESLSQQHDSLLSRLRDHEASCSENTARCFRDGLRNLQQWNDAGTTENSANLQESLEEGEKYRLDLQEALSHRQFLSDCLSPPVFEKLNQESSETLAKAEAQKNTLQALKEECAARPKHKLEENQQPSETEILAPPRKSKRSQMMPASSIQSINRSTEEEPMQVEPVVWAEESQQQSVKDDAGPTIKGMDNKDDKRETTPAASQETPVALRRKSKTAASEPETKQMKMEAKLPETFETTILDDRQALTTPFEIAGNATEQVKAGSEESDKAKAAPLSEVTTKAVPPKRKPKSPKLSPKEIEINSTPSGSTEAERGSGSNNAVVVPARRKSKTTPPAEISLEKPSQDSTQESAKLSPTKKRSKKSKSSPETAPKEVKINKAGEDTKLPELEDVKTVPDTVPEQMEATEEMKLIAPRRKSKIADLPQKSLDTAEIGASSESISVPEVSENGKVVPPKRKPKSPKASPAIAKKDLLQEEARQDTALQGKNLQTASQPSTGYVNGKPTVVSEPSIEKPTEETGSMSPTKRRSKARPKIFPELSENSTEEVKDEAKITTSPAETTAVEGLSVSPPKRRSKKAKDSPLLSKKEVDESQSKAPAVVEAVGSLSPPKRRPKGKKADIDNQTDGTEKMQEKKVATLVLEMPGTIPQNISKEIIFKLKEDETSAIDIQLTNEEEKPTAAEQMQIEHTVKISQKADFQTVSESVKPISMKLTDKPSCIEDLEEKKVATIILEMPDFSPLSVSQSSFSDNQDKVKSLGARDAITDKKKAKASKKATKDVSMEKDQIHKSIEEVEIIKTDATSKKKIIPVSKTAEYIGGTEEGEEKKVAILVLEMQDETTMAKPNETESSTQETKETTISMTEPYANPVQDLASKPPFKLTKPNASVCEVAIDHVDDLPVIEKTKVATTVILETHDSETSTFAETVPEEATPKEDPEKTKTDAEVTEKSELICLGKQIAKDQLDLVTKAETTFKPTSEKEDMETSDAVSSTEQKDLNQSVPKYSSSVFDNTKPDAARTTNDNLDKSENTIIQPKVTREHFTSVEMTDQSELISNQWQHLEEVMEEKTKLSEITKTEISDGELPKVETSVDGVSAINEEIVLSDAETTQVIPEKSKPAIRQPKEIDGTIKPSELTQSPSTETESKDVKLPKEVETSVDSVSTISENIVLGDAETTHVIPEKTKTDISQPGEIDSTDKASKVIQLSSTAFSHLEEGVSKHAQVPHDVENIQLSLDSKNITEDSLEQPQILQDDEITFQSGQKEIIKGFDATEKMPEEPTVLSEAQITSELEKVDLSVNNIQPLEETVVAEETIVEYISIARKPRTPDEAIERSKEDQMASKMSDYPPEMEEVAHLSEVEPQNETIEVVGKALAKTEENVLEEPEESVFRNIFSDIQQLTESCASAELLKVKPVQETPETLLTCVSLTPEQGQVNQLLSRVLDCKNQAASPRPEEMRQQLADAKECRVAALAQVSLLSEQRRGGEVSSQAAELVEDQWRCSVQDLDAVIQKKEAELELVTEYCQQLEEAQSSVEELSRDLDSVTKSSGQSYSEEAEQLCSLQTTLENRKTLLIQLLQNYKKLHNIFTRPEKTAAQNDLKNLQNQFRLAEKTVDRLLHDKTAVSSETNAIKTDISNLMEKQKSIAKEIDKIQGNDWNCNDAQRLMVLNAELKALQQQFCYFKELAEDTLPKLQWENDHREIQDSLQEIDTALQRTEKKILSKNQTSSNPVMEKILAVMKDAFSWAKKTEMDIEGRQRRVPLLPEDVYHQLKDLKKLQSEVMTKQGQLEVLVEDANELFPQLDEREEVPMVNSSLKSLEELSKSTTEKLVKAIREIESGLQTREKLNQQMADLDSWILAYFNKDALSCPEFEMTLPELERQARQIHEAQSEAQRQASVCKALLEKGKEIAPELSIAENCLLFTRLTNLNDDVQDIMEREKANMQEVEECFKMVEAGKQSVIPIEKSLRQMLVDLNRPKFPITKKSLQALQPIKNTIAELKSQVGLQEQSLPEEKAKELHGLVDDLENRMSAIDSKMQDHEMYLSLRKFLEELKESMKDQVRQSKEETKDIEKYKSSQSLLVQFPAINELCREVKSQLYAISMDLYPSQLNGEQLRLKQTEDSLNTMEMTLKNTLSIIERDLVKDMDVETEGKASTVFLTSLKKDLSETAEMRLTDADVEREYRRVLAMRKTVEMRMRAWDLLRWKGRKEQGAEELNALKKEVLEECDAQLASITEARQSLKTYSSTVRRVVLLFLRLEVRLLFRYGPRGLCSERSDQIRDSLDSLDQDFRSLVDQLETCFPPQNRFLSPAAVKALQEETVSKLLVMMSTVKAKAQIEIDRLSSCVEQYDHYCQQKVPDRVESAEETLNELTTQRVTCLRDCSDQQHKLDSLCSEMEVLQESLRELKQWCPEQSCRRRRDAAAAILFKRVSRLRRCLKKLRSRCEQRISEWSNITDCVEKAESVLSQVEAEFPKVSPMRTTTEELHEVVPSWEQYQDRLDCEHRALSALELRVARLLGVPAHLEEAPPAPLCQQLQAMQNRYNHVGESSSRGLSCCRSELEQRERCRDELQRLKVWLQAADRLFSEPETGNAHDIQEALLQLFTQRSLLEQISNSVSSKYSDPESVVPAEIYALLHDVQRIMQQIEPKVNNAAEKSGPVYRLGAKLSEIQSGLNSVQKRLDQKSPTAAEAKVTQKRVWDELDVWHSCLAALEGELQDLDRPEEALVLTERLVEVQHAHAQLAKQAEQRTTLLSKIHTWLQEHQEMINSSNSWINEAKTWLAAPATYTTAKCLSSHVHALQVVLGDSAQIRRTLQSFSTVLEEMSQVCEVEALKQQLIQADQEVGEVQDSFTAPLSRLQHATEMVEAIEAEVRKMENDVAEIKDLLASPETSTTPKAQRLKLVEEKVRLMQETIDQLQGCRPDLGLPEQAAQTLTVFAVIEHLQALLLELQKKIPGLFVPQADAPRQSPFLPRFERTTSEEKEEGEIAIVHVKDDVLSRSGAELLTVEKTSPEQTESTPSDAQPSDGGSVEEQDSGLLWWLWDFFLGESPQEPRGAVAAGTMPDQPQTQEEQEAEAELSGSVPTSATADDEEEGAVFPSTPSESSVKRCIVS